MSSAAQVLRIPPPSQVYEFTSDDHTQRLNASPVLRQAEALKVCVSDSNKGISETWVARQRLEDLYKKLLLMDLEYALDKKVEQDLWNHAFKNHINNLQSQTKDKQNPKRSETQATLNLFLETASGFYLQLLQLICTTFKLDLPFRRKSSCFGILKEKIPLRVKITPPKKSSCLYICQHCLVHLGDIARYRQQIEQAQTYYWHAANLLPFNGQPYNQLAIVEAAYGNKLSTVFYYIRSLAVRHPFPVAATNLEKLYNKLAKDPCELKGKLSVTEMITAFLQFQAFVHMCVELQRAELLSEKLVAALPAHVTSQSFPSSILVQIIAINIFAMQHARRQLAGDTEDLSDGHLYDSLTVDEETSFQLMFKFTISVLDVLLQYTPKQEQKLRDFFTLPAVKLLLDWFRLNPEHLHNPVLKTSSLWTNLCKVLNNIRPPTAAKDGKYDIAKYEDLPLTEDAELRCFQPLEKAHTGYSFSRVPSEGLPSDVEAQLRCQRLLNHGRWIAEEYPGLNLLSIQTNKPGKVQFTAPSAPVKALTSVIESQPQSSPERKSRQNVAIQAIIQKQNEKEQTSGEKVVKIHQSVEKVKSVDVSERGGKGSSPKYILGVPTSEPLFMKPSGGRTPSGGGTGSSRPQIQTPPRLQKQQQLAQQQLQTHPEEEEEEPSCQPTKQPQKPSQDPAVKLTKIAWQLSPLNELSAPLSTTQQNSVHQMSSLQSSGGQLQPSPQQSPQNGLSVSSGQQKPVAPPHHQNRMASPLTQPQPPGQSPKPVVILQADFRSPPRMPVNQPNQQHKQPPASKIPAQSLSVNSSGGEFDTVGYNHHMNTPEAGPVRTKFDSSLASRNPGPQGFQMDRPPPSISQGHGQSPGQIQGHPQVQGQMQSQGQGQGQLQGHGQVQSRIQGHEGSTENVDIRGSLQHQQVHLPPPGRTGNPNMPYLAYSAGVGGNSGNMRAPPSSQQSGPLGSQFSRNHPPPNMFYSGQQGNMPRPMSYPPVSDRNPGPGGPGGMDRMPGSHTFNRQSNPSPMATHPPHGPSPQNPHERGPPQPRGPHPQQNQLQRGPLSHPPHSQGQAHPSHPQGQGQAHPSHPQGQAHPSHPQGQAHPPQSQPPQSHPRQQHTQPPQQQHGTNPGYQGPMFNPLNFLAGISRFNLGAQNFGNMDQGLELMRQSLKKDDLPPSAADIIGALSLLAVQPPHGVQDTLTVPSRHTSFQGHAEGTPKPDSSTSPCRSPLLTPEVESRPVSQVSLPSATPQQLGTYTLFSTSPWSVPLSTAETKSLASSSPFSSESNSIRNSPDPPTEVYTDNKPTGHGFEMGLRFGPTEDQHWREKGGQPMPHPESQAMQGQGGPGPFFPSPFQSIWSSGNSSAGQSPLERLLEKQKQRQNDPH